MPTITNTGPEAYSGYREPGTPASGLLHLEPGAAAEVSEAKAEQLLRDFPEAFALAEGAPADPKPTRGRRRRQEP